MFLENRFVKSTLLGNRLCSKIDFFLKIIDFGLERVFLISIEFNLFDEIPNVCLKHFQENNKKCKLSLSLSLSLSFEIKSYLFKSILKKTILNLFTRKEKID
jgi:hypothetical protein